MRKTTLTCLLLLGLAGPAAAQYELSTDPIAGEAVQVTLPQPADTLVVTYRPNSSIVTTDHILTNGAQTVSWTPRQAGVVAISTPGGAVQNVSVRFRTVPLGGVFVLIVAGTILFGGAIFALRKLFEDEEALPEPAHRPDT